MDEQKLKAALTKEASQVNLPPDLLGRIYQTAERPSWWTRLRVGAKLEIAAAFLLLAGLGAIIGLRSANSPEPVINPPPPTATGCGKEPPAGGSRPGTVWVYFTCADDPLPGAPRALPRVGSDLRAALVELVKGPTAEERALGFQSFFSSKTAGMIRSVTETEGKVVIDFADFREAMPNASTSAGAGQLMRELTQTIFQFESVGVVEIRMEGSCDTFWRWLQSDCQMLVREGRPAPAVSEEAAVMAAKAADPRASAEGWATWQVRLGETPDSWAAWVIDATHNDGERVRIYVSVAEYPPRVLKVDRFITREQAVQAGLQGVNTTMSEVKEAAFLPDYRDEQLPNGGAELAVWRLVLVSKTDQTPQGAIVVDAITGQVLTVSNAPSGQ